MPVRCGGLPSRQEITKVVLVAAEESTESGSCVHKDLVTSQWEGRPRGFYLTAALFWGCSLRTLFSRDSVVGQGCAVGANFFVVAKDRRLDSTALLHLIAPPPPPPLSPD